jgi:hypothetical protein
MDIILRSIVHRIARSVHVSGIFFVVIFGTTSLPAIADDGALYVAPGPSNLISSDVIKRNQYQAAGTARKLGDIVGSSLKSSTSRATDLLVTTKCGHYQSAMITFSDGLVKTLNLSNAPASQQDMDNAKAAIPLLRIVELGGCDP